MNDEVCINVVKGDVRFGGFLFGLDYSGCSISFRLKCCHSFCLFGALWATLYIFFICKTKNFIYFLFDYFPLHILCTTVWNRLYRLKTKNETLEVVDGKIISRCLDLYHLFPFIYFHKSQCFVLPYSSRNIAGSSSGPFSYDLRE